jgi:DNA gyrase subunit A
VYQIPEGSKTSKGRAIQNLIQIEPDDKIRTILNVPSLDDEDYINNHYVIMCTEQGTIKKTSLEAYSRPRQTGINAINIVDGDRLLDVEITDGDAHIIIATREGQAIHFHESDVRPMGRTATGVRGISLAEGDVVVGMVCVSNEDEDLLVVSEKGYGKRSKVSDYRITRRGGKGVRTMNITGKTGKLVGIKAVSDEDEIMIINKSGITIRMRVSDIRVMGRATQGVRLIKLTKKDDISSIAKVDKDNEEEDTPKSFSQENALQDSVE